MRGPWIWWTSWFWISDLYVCISTCCRRGWLRVRWGFWIMCACSLPIFFWALCLLLDQQHMLFSPHLYFHNWYTNKYYYLFLKAFSILSLGPHPLKAKNERILQNQKKGRHFGSFWIIFQNLGTLCIIKCAFLWVNSTLYWRKRSFASTSRKEDILHTEKHINLKNVF